MAKDKKPIPSPPKPKIEGKPKRKGRPILPAVRPKNISLEAWRVMQERAGVTKNDPDAVDGSFTRIFSPFPASRDEDAEKAIRGELIEVDRPMAKRQAKGGKVAKMAHGGGIELRGKTRGRIT